VAADLLKCVYAADLLKCVYTLYKGCGEPYTVHNGDGVDLVVSLWRLEDSVH